MTQIQRGFVLMTQSHINPNIDLVSAWQTRRRRCWHLLQALTSTH